MQIREKSLRRGVAESPLDNQLRVFVSLAGQVDSPTIGYLGGECFIRPFALAQYI